MGDHCSWQILKLVLQMFVPQLHCKVRSLNLKTGTENGTLPFPLPDIMILNLKTLKTPLSQYQPSNISGSL